MTDAEFELGAGADPEFARELYRAVVEQYERDLDRRDARIRQLQADRDAAAATLDDVRRRLGRLHGT